MMKNLIVSLSIIVCSLSALAQELDIGKINSRVAEVRKEHNLPGIAVGIIQNGEIEFQQGYGYAKMGESSKINTSSMFGIASLSKAFTAAAMGMLVDEGKVKWTDKVVDILPDWKLNDDAVTQMFTVEDLLCHRSGLKTFDGDLLWYGTNYSRKEIIKRIRHLPLSYDFRAGFGYQNIMYITAGEVIEKVSGTTWDNFVTTRILKPLAMFKTTTSITKYTEKHKIAYPHIDGKPQALMNYDNSGATAALNSNVIDMQKWIMFLLNEGIYDGDTLLQPATLHKMWSVINPLPVSPKQMESGTNFSGYGMGWFVNDFNGVKVVEHGGGLPGYITKVFLVPEREFGMVILTNDMSPACTALMKEILEMLTGVEKPVKWSQRYAAFMVKKNEADSLNEVNQNNSRKLETQPGAEMSAFVGTYTDSYYGTATMAIVGKGKKARLQLTLDPAKEIFTAKLEHWENNTYVFNFKDEFLPRGFANFEIKDGVVSSFTIDLPNPDFHFSNLHFKR